MDNSLHATTIYAVRHNGGAAMAGDGQVTLGQQVIMKQTARKVRRLYDGKVLAGFAGSVADAFTLLKNSKLNYNNLAEILKELLLNLRKNGEEINNYVNLRQC